MRGKCNTRRWRMNHSRCGSCRLTSRNQSRLILKRGFTLPCPRSGCFKGNISTSTPRPAIIFDSDAAFRAIAGVAFFLAFGLALLGNTLYPRWAGLALPAVYLVVALLLGPYVPVRAGVVLRAGGWNLGGAALFALSTALLWNRDA